MKTWEQTAEDMDRRFSGGFQAAGGNSQSLTFMIAAISRLPDTFTPLTQFTYTDTTRLIEGMTATIADYGCALGDGTAVIQGMFPLSEVVGYDISPKAVEIAKERWPHMEFEVGDITNPKSHGIVFASHVIEHMQHPDEVVQRLIDLHQLTVIIVPTIQKDIEYESHKGAVPTEEWLSKLPLPMYHTRYNTVRADIENDEADHICEGNSMYVWFNADYNSDDS
jgi:hypothetical protein